jgi:hypothetical protein
MRSFTNFHESSRVLQALQGIFPEILDLISNFQEFLGVLGIFQKFQQLLKKSGPRNIRNFQEFLQFFRCFQGNFRFFRQNLKIKNHVTYLLILNFILNSEKYTFRRSKAIRVIEFVDRV